MHNNKNVLYNTFACVCKKDDTMQKLVLVQFRIKAKLEGKFRTQILFFDTYDVFR